MDEASKKQSFLIPGYNSKKPKERLYNLLWRLMAPLPDDLYVRLKYLFMMGRWPNLSKPTRYTEKIQARKLYDRDPKYAELIDKASAKCRVSKVIGDQYTIPTYWVGTDLTEVNWDQFEKPFIIKPTHTSGQGATIYDDEDLRKFLAKAEYKKWLTIRHQFFNREWAYSQIKPQILVESMIQTSQGIPWDHRFYVFDGVVRLIEINIRENGKGYSSYYSPDWDALQVHDPHFLPAYPKQLAKPAKLDEMLEIARKLGKEHDFVRVDLYADADWIKFGELTFYPSGGYDYFEPENVDEWLGSFWQQQL